MIDQAVRRFLAANGIRGAVVVAVSGGGDSTALLLVLAESGVPIVAAHVNHHLRGKESDDDEAFVCELCQRLGITLEDALAESPELRQAYGSDPDVRELIDIAKTLEGTRLKTPGGEISVRAADHQALMPMVVSVVTRDVSDDCNSFVVPGNQIWLRAARIGRAHAFHASTDGRRWQLVRHFRLTDADTVEVGFIAQSPVGEGCGVTFSNIAFEPVTLGDLRDGT